MKHSHITIHTFDARREVPNDPDSKVVIHHDPRLVKVTSIETVLPIKDWDRGRSYVDVDKNYQPLPADFQSWLCLKGEMRVAIVESVYDVQRLIDGTE